MPFRTKNTYSTPSGGVVNTKKKTYSGRGRAPAGTHRVKEPTARTAPTVTTSPTGKVTAQHFKSVAAASHAIKRQRSTQTKVDHVLAQLEKTRQARTKRGVSPMVSHVPQPASPSAEKIALVTKAPKVSTPKLKGTPPQRQRVRRKLQSAKETLHHTPALKGPLQPDQRRFDEAVAHLTKLNPRTIGAQSLAEESSTAAAQRQAEGNQNWLNIGPGAQLAPTPKGAAKETAKLINTSSYYSGIRASRGKGPRRQIEAIAASPWGTVGSTMRGTLPLVGISPAKKAARGRVSELTAKARSLGMKTGSPSGEVGPAPKQVVTRFKAGLAAAKELAKGHIPYVWGGGHGAPHSEPTGGGLDCSGAVGYVLNKMGVLKGSLTSGEMGSVLKPGPGAVTVFYNSTHTFMSFGGKFFGTSVNDSSKGLAFYKNPGSAYLSQYSVGHVAGLGKKQALQLGLSAPSSFPGMTLSSSGATALINPGAGTTQSKPGFSKSPIKLTPAQKTRHTLRELTALGAGVGEAKSEAAPSRKGLKELETKYGSPAV